MFYTQKTDKALRFGDVLQGYPSTTPIIKGPIPKGSLAGYGISVDLPEFTVVMDPCCEIGNKTISLTPFIQVSRKFLDNPYFVGDLTRINRKMDPQQTVSPLSWETFSLEEKQKRLEVGPTHALLNLFVYEKHDLFPKYRLRRKDQEDIETNYYMIDFRNTYKLCCDKIISAKDSPVESKVLQLSIETRSELREKLARYYSSIPDEDRLEQ